MTLYLDMDGVLADFDAGAEAVLGASPQSYKRCHGESAMWRALHAVPGFYAGLPMMADAPVLWEAVRHLRPVILTGVPGSLPEAADDKRRWAARWFPRTEVITCASRDKALYCRVGDVIIDDRPRYRHLWERAGGRWITHTSARESLSQLAEIMGGAV